MCYTVSPRALRLTPSMSSAMPNSDGLADDHGAFRSTSYTSCTVVPNLIQPNLIASPPAAFPPQHQWVFPRWGASLATTPRSVDCAIWGFPRAEIVESSCKHQSPSQRATPCSGSCCDTKSSLHRHVERVAMEWCESVRYWVDAVRRIMEPRFTCTRTDKDACWSNVDATAGTWASHKPKCRGCNQVTCKTPHCSSPADRTKLISTTITRAVCWTA